MIKLYVLYLDKPDRRPKCFLGVNFVTAKWHISNHHRRAGTSTNRLRAIYTGVAQHGGRNVAAMSDAARQRVRSNREYKNWPKDASKPRDASRQRRQITDHTVSLPREIVVYFLPYCLRKSKRRDGEMAKRRNGKISK